ncbi:MAG TPA: DUF1800 family protein [Wenzhouxiangella sp.]
MHQYKVRFNHFMLGLLAALSIGALGLLAPMLSVANSPEWTKPSHLSGSWFDPAKDGQGMVVQVLNPTTVLMTWFTFDHEGNPAWLQGVGSFDGDTATFDELLRFEGPKFGPSFDPADRQSIPSGSLSITFKSCDAAEASFKGIEPFIDDTLNLGRLTSVAGFNCKGAQTPERFPVHHGLSGAWYAPEQDGQGWMVEVLNNTQALVYWFTYDSEGRQRWLVGVGDRVDEAIVVNDLQWAQGAQFGPEFDPNDVERISWGQATLKLYPCTGASVQYVEGRAHLSKSGEITGVEPLASIEGNSPCPKYIDKWVASRVVEQTTFGPSPRDEARIKELGIEAWVDEQLAMPPSYVEYEDLKCYGNYFTEEGRMKPTEYPFWEQVPIQMMDHFVGSPDQLRLRLSWALSQLVVISTRASDIQEVGAGVYFNMLQEYGLTNYRDILREVTLSPAMGQFLDNAGSYATSEDCPNCIPNENYARELLMLFTLGVNQLNMDGTVKTDESGRPLEVFKQKDVMELARAISGWRVRRFEEEPPNSKDRQLEAQCPSGDFFYGWDGHLVPETQWPRNAHDPGEKELLGVTIPARQGIREDLESVLDILMNHPNMPPFISYRLIQHLTTSNPSPSYVQRVSEVFADNGRGVRGDMKAVVRAIILDPEARAGDDPDKMPNNFGRIRDLVQHHTAVYRGMECGRMPTREFREPRPMDFNKAKRFNPQWPRNRPLGADEVFSFYPPNNPVPGMDLISPEHMISNTRGIEARMSSLPGDERYLNVCNFGAFKEAAKQSPEALVSLISERYLRGRDEFDHKSYLLDMAEGLQGFLEYREQTENVDEQNHMYPFTMFIGYSLLGEEFGVVR